MQWLKELDPDTQASVPGAVLGRWDRCASSGRDFHLCEPHSASLSVNGVGAGSSCLPYMDDTVISGMFSGCGY